MEEEKHIIAILVENVLYNRIISFDEDNRLDFKTKEKNKQEMIDIFVNECLENSKVMSES